MTVERDLAAPWARGSTIVRVDRRGEPDRMSGADDAAFNAAMRACRAESAAAEIVRRKVPPGSSPRAQATGTGLLAEHASAMRRHLDDAHAAMRRRDAAPPRVPAPRGGASPLRPPPGAGVRAVERVAAIVWGVIELIPGILGGLAVIVIGWGIIATETISALGLVGGLALIAGLIVFMVGPPWSS